MLKAVVQYLTGTEACASRVKPVSIICQCRRSTKPFCSGVLGHESL
jgi:CDGSH-type Zn-finger protein